MVGSMFTAPRYVVSFAFLRPCPDTPQTFKMVWSWFAGAEKPGVFEVDWQFKDGYNRISLALEGRKVMVLDCTKIPALQ